MKPNPFRCPSCGLPANNVDGDPFAQDAEQLSSAQSMTIAVECDNRHRWFEEATFSRPVIDWATLEVAAPRVVSRITGPATEVTNG